MTRLVAERTKFLRTVLKLDAVVSGLNGVGYLVAAGPLATLFGTSTSLLLGLGVFLVLWAAALVIIATRSRMSRRAVWAVVVVNALWVVDTVVLVAAGALSTIGIGWAAVQAIVVAGFVVLAVLGLRRAQSAAGVG